MWCRALVLLTSEFPIFLLKVFPIYLRQLYDQCWPFTIKPLIVDNKQKLLKCIFYRLDHHQQLSDGLHSAATNRSVIKPNQSSKTLIKSGLFERGSQIGGFEPSVVLQMFLPAAINHFNSSTWVRPTHTEPDWTQLTVLHHVLYATTYICTPVHL